MFSGSALVLLTNPLRALAAANSYSMLTPELTEGPFYIDAQQIRRDITEGKAGAPLRMRIQVRHVISGAPIPEAAVDVWHCDARGVYSGFDGVMPPPPGFGNFPPPPPRDGDFRPPPPPPGMFGHHMPANRSRFLRGVQLTDANGLAEFITIVPGWYPGRAPHIHVRVHSGGITSDGRYRKGHLSHTGQIFLPSAITAAAYRMPAYRTPMGERTMLEDDDIFIEGGRELARVSMIDPVSARAGFASDSLLVIDPSARRRG